MAAGRAESVIQFGISLVPRTDELDRVRELARTADADALDLVGIREHPFVERTITRASEAYGTFALVLGLLSWFGLFSHLLLLAAEVNVVLRRRLWPRSLTGEPGSRRPVRAPAGRGSDAAGRAAGDPRLLQRRPWAGPDLNGGVSFPAGHWTASLPLQPARLRICHMDASAGFGTSRLFLTDSRLALAVLNHLRYQALNRVFGVSRDQANVLTVVLLLGAADGAYEAARRISGMRLRVSGTDAALGAFALREAALGVAGPSAREVPGFGTLVAFAILGGLAAPSLRRTAQRMRAAEARVRRERIRRYVAAQDRARASAA